MLWSPPTPQASESVSLGGGRRTPSLQSLVGQTAAPVRTLREGSGADGVIGRDTHWVGGEAATSAVNLRFQ